MISKKMQEAINAQINAEMWSAYLYLSMSMDAADKGFAGSAHWFARQFSEEQEHAEKLAKYLQSQSAKVLLAPIAAVKTQWASVKEMFAETLEHEQKVTAMIHELCKLAQTESDFATANMLQWFVNEQVEEEETARGILGAFEMVEGEKAGTYLLDQKLGAR
ncbi:ferritin [uncultured Alistipes sp.]|uniref:ferritin n=1 Tax=uncultured Alistipes sp. TaxID=538949 RepID=UPI00263407BC|nr:ferritin [uncultured Alistipes sp.]